VVSDSSTGNARPLYRVYRQWAEGAGEKAITETMFGRRLKGRGFLEGHKKFAVALCCLLPPFWRPAKMLFRALARWELADVSRVAFFEGFAKRLHIAVSSLSAL